MIYWKEECARLASSQAVVVVVDRYDENRVPVFALRRALAASGSRSGKNSYWSVVLDKPLGDGCDAVTFPFILATADCSSAYGVVIDSTRLDSYHPAWTLDGYEKELRWRKESAIYAIERMINDFKIKMI